MGAAPLAGYKAALQGKTAEENSYRVGYLRNNNTKYICMIYRRKKTLCQTGAQCAVLIDVTQIVALMQCKCVVSAIPLHLIHFNIVQDFVHGTVQFVVLQCVQIAAHCIMQMQCGGAE